MKRLKNKQHLQEQIVQRDNSCAFYAFQLASRRTRVILRTKEMQGNAARKCLLTHLTPRETDCKRRMKGECAKIRIFCTKLTVEMDRIGLPLMNMLIFSQSCTMPEIKLCAHQPRLSLFCVDKHHAGTYLLHWTSWRYSSRLLHL